MKAIHFISYVVNQWVKKASWLFLDLTCFLYKSICCYYNLYIVVFITLQSLIPCTIFIPSTLFPISFKSKSFLAPKYKFNNQNINYKFWAAKGQTLHFSNRVENEISFITKMHYVTMSGNTFQGFNQVLRFITNVQVYQSVSSSHDLST